MRLWRAKASRGESSGGASPAICKRGERRGLEALEKPEACEFARSSNKFGRLSDMVKLAKANPDLELMRAGSATWATWRRDLGADIGDGIGGSVEINQV